MTITNEIEMHPFAPFVPKNAHTLIIGSFPGQNQNQLDKWFYSADKNMFWDLISTVYNVELKTVEDKKALFTKLGIAITDIFLKVRRKKPSNSDSDLIPVEYNEKAIQEILSNNQIKQIIFTSKFVENQFRKVFKDIKNTICLPSPSQQANIPISISTDFKDYVKANPNGDTKSFRIYKYSQIFRELA